MHQYSCNLEKNITVDLINITLILGNKDKASDHRNTPSLPVTESLTLLAISEPQGMVTSSQQGKGVCSGIV